MFAAQQAVTSQRLNGSSDTRFSSKNSLIRALFGSRVVRLAKRMPLASLAIVALAGCAELRGRHEARKGNDLFREGKYQEAIKHYEESQRIFPGFPTSTLNMGLACRQLLSPGSDSPANKKAADCALAQFSRLQKIAPADERGAQLYEQTLFDAGRYTDLEKMYLGRLEKEPGNLRAVNALIQVYTRSDNWSKTLKWDRKRAELAPNDPDAHYSVGVRIFNRLLAKGGSGLVARFDPRPEAINAFLQQDPTFAGIEEGTIPPFFSTSDIVGSKRVKLADLGLSHLTKALELRSDYTEAMVFSNLLLRQKAMAFLAVPEKWQANIEKAEVWRKRASKAQGRQTAAAAKSAAKDSPDGKNEEL